MDLAQMVEAWMCHGLGQRTLTKDKMEDTALGTLMALFSLENPKSAMSL